jgi:CsbD-like
MPDKSIDKVKGRVKEAAGALTGDRRLKNEGRADQARSSVRTPWTRSPTPSAAARETRSGGRHARAEDRPCVTRQRLSSISWARFLRRLPIALGATRGS